MFTMFTIFIWDSSFDSFPRTISSSAKLSEDLLFFLIFTWWTRWGKWTFYIRQFYRHNLRNLIFHPFPTFIMACFQSEILQCNNTLSYYINQLDIVKIKPIVLEPGQQSLVLPHHMIIELVHFNKLSAALWTRHAEIMRFIINTR